MDTAIVVAIIGVIGGVLADIGVFIMWWVKRKADKEDKKDAFVVEVKERVSVLETNQQGMEKSINELALVQKMTVDGVSYIVDGLETKKILNGTGKKYLKDINNYYKKKGFEALQFHSLEAPKSSVRKKAE